MKNNEEKIVIKFSFAIWIKLQQKKEEEESMWKKTKQIN